MKHTHYDPYGPPRQVPGTLLDCADPFRDLRHKVEDSELWADYTYAPWLGPHSATGLPAHETTRLYAAYTAHRSHTVSWRVADVVPDDNHTWLVKITNRTAYTGNGDGPLWHTETWGLVGADWVRIPKNPHPGYDHTPPFCPNCGY